MILFTILTIILIGLLIFLALMISIFGAMACIVFADVIVCVGIIVFIMRRILRRR